MPNVLCLLAHPDDEIFCADLLSRLTKRGCSLRFGCCTRGGGGRHFGDPPQATRATLGTIREREMQRSAEALGADGVTFLEYVDPPSTQGHQAPEHDPAQLMEDIQALIEAEVPDLVLTHGSGGEYGHPAHRLLHERTKAAVDRMSSQPALYSFSAYHPVLPELNIINRWDWAGLRLQARPYAEAKVQALLCHQTQWAAFVGEQETDEDYRAALIDHVESLPDETYCCHRTGRKNVSPTVINSWLGREPGSSEPRFVNAAQDTIRKYRHLARIAAGEGILALRQFLRS